MCRWSRRVRLSFLGVYKLIFLGILVSLEFFQRFKQLFGNLQIFLHSAMRIPACFVLLFCIVLAVAFLTTPASAGLPARVGTCIRNCAQCKKMFGPYFEGQLCADTCVKFKGKMIPDCEDADSIAPFIRGLDDD